LSFRKNRPEKIGQKKSARKNRPEKIDQKKSTRKIVNKTGRFAVRIRAEREDSNALQFRALIPVFTIPVRSFFAQVMPDVPGNG
jgi:hypothetical protein